MTTISKDHKLVTLINVFTVEPANQQQLLELLVRATETSCTERPGFHFRRPSQQPRWHEGRHVRSVAQCRGLPSDARESRFSALYAAGACPGQVRAWNV